MMHSFPQTYPGHIGAVNITVRNTEVYYTFRIRASNLVDGIQNYGEFSEVTPESTVFVPAISMLLFLTIKWQLDVYLFVCIC